MQNPPDQNRKTLNKFNIPIRNQSIKMSSVPTLLVMVIRLKIIKH